MTDSRFYKMWFRVKVFSFGKPERIYRPEDLMGPSVRDI